MPKMTAFKQMSKTEREAYLASLPKSPPPKVKPDATVRVAREQSVDASEKDGLMWLIKKNRLKAPQVREALFYSDLVRAAPAGALKVSDLTSVGGGSGTGGIIGGEYGDSAAALQLYVIRQHVLGGEMGGENDLLIVMDGVCGRRQTVRALAGGDQYRSHELLAALRIALNLMVAVRQAKEAANRARTPQNRAA